MQHISIVWTLSAILASPSAFDLQLEDQYEKPRTLASTMNDKPLVMVYGSEKDTPDYMKPWIEAITKIHGSRIDLVGLARLDGVPFFVPNGVIRSDMQEDFPNMTMLCDWKAKLSEALKLPQGPIFVVIFSPDRRELGRIAGALSDANKQQLAKLINMP